MKKVVVIGGGIAGLSLAYSLIKQGFDVTLIEKENRVGGALNTVLKNNKYIIEYGPNTFLSTSDSIANLISDLNLNNQCVTNDKVSKKRYIYKNGKLRLVPKSPSSFISSRLLTTRGKIRALCEPLIRSKTQDTESLAEFVKRRAGTEILDNLVDPFVSGVYAGDPYQLEIKSIFPKLVEIEDKYKSIFKGMKHLAGHLKNSNLVSFKWGMETLTAAIYDKIKKNIKTNASVESIKSLSNKLWTVNINQYKEVIRGNALVFATPPNETARLLMPLIPEIFPILVDIPYIHLVVVHTAFRKKDLPIRPDGFGFLVPRNERIRMLGSIWSSTLFTNRSPEDEVLLTNFIGGATDPDAINLDDQELISHIKYGLEKTMGITSEPLFWSIRRIGQAIPQYTIGHMSRLNKLEACLEKLPGIFMTGSYFSGISVSDTIGHAQSTANNIKNYL